jgi:hypothetical protein
MNNYQKTKERNEQKVSDIAGKFEAYLNKHELFDEEADNLLKELRGILATSQTTKDLFFEVFTNIGDTISKKDAFMNTDGRVCIDARQLYQWRKKGYIVAETGKGSNIYKYVNFDAVKNAAYKADQKAKRDAKK